MVKDTGPSDKWMGSDKRKGANIKCKCGAHNEIRHESDKCTSCGKKLRR